MEFLDDPVPRLDMEFPTAINVIKPDVSEAKQLDDGIDDTFVSRWGEVSFAID